ncbi:hypothetical protein N0V93_006759 [Gnomoniopsis smithogilvyi]|uniref:Uncharacterized protein n=1 Tax=Gnomoniopsis smithogilvyi TaxID=1191159 RepID=A0A9W8YQ00_9PEZI|nr:hypothetical protein N0V93_006759 [Gnomoniopsis smithogilvyi]
MLRGGPQTIQHTYHQVLVRYPKKGRFPIAHWPRRGGWGSNTAVRFDPADHDWSRPDFLFWHLCTTYPVPTIHYSTVLHNLGTQQPADVVGRCIWWKYSEFRIHILDSGNVQ